ncbi:hypothetical protein JKP88DRAFT_337718 [Tribonema minus]|uniref:Rhodanese domain-containing protein n=1 Tax=Tribonema minus TaxID=303371 RepID=A0A835YR13_9STRA|nr:hypothetical protein JKP88DRAFT_337718 [Tribonema minus]
MAVYSGSAAELQRLQSEVAQLKERLSLYEESGAADDQGGVGHDQQQEQHQQRRPNSILTNGEIWRYSRQLLVPGLGAEVLVIGAGGLGSALLPYLAGAGVGTIGVVDFDTVEGQQGLSKARQTLYREGQQGLSKARCAAQALRALNSSVTVNVHEQAFGHYTAEALLQGYDAVVDASDNPHMRYLISGADNPRTRHLVNDADNPRTRYLVNDACVTLGGKPLISGSALGLEGQVTVYHHRSADGSLGPCYRCVFPQGADGKLGPCYRCVFPQPMAHEAGRRCSDNGVVGPVTGVIGSLQALETLKVLGGFGTPLSGRLSTYDGADGTHYALALRPRRAACEVCGDAPVIKTMEDSRRWCEEQGLGGGACLRLPEDLPSIRCPFATDKCALDANFVFSICRLDGAVNVPYAALARAGGGGDAEIEKLRALAGDAPVYCMCRRGIDSRRAAALLQARGGFPGGIYDVAGGLVRWREDVDPDFPLY